MKKLPPLAQIEIAAAVSLIGVCVGFGLFLATLALVEPSEFWQAPSAFMLGSTIALALGVLPALLVGAPSYWALWRAGHGGWWKALLLGVGLGSLMGLADMAFAGWGALCGGLVALLTHAISQRWLPPSPRRKRRGKAHDEHPRLD